MECLSWTCDFCKKGMVTISPAGVLYCERCRMSYGKTVYEELEVEESEIQKI